MTPAHRPAVAPPTFPLAEGVVAAFTTTATGNLAHRRPHVPAELHASRRALAEAFGLEVADLHHMRQVHGGAVGRVTSTTTPGAEVRDVDGLVTDQPGRALVVQAADCVPVLVAADHGPVGVAHAGRAGIAANVVGNLVAELLALGADSGSLHAAVGPAIGPCCYEVPEAMVAEVAQASGLEGVVASTTWGTPSLDLPGAAEAQLQQAGVADVTSSPGCTRCGGDAQWFSHRRNPDAGRHVGVVVLAGRAQAAVA